MTSSFNNTNDKWKLKKKVFGFFFQKWQFGRFPKIEENQNYHKLLEIVSSGFFFTGMTLWDVPKMVLFRSGFFFHKWRSGDFPEFGHNQLSSRDISFTWHHVTDVMVPIGSLGDDVTGDHDVIGCPIYVTSSQAKNWIMDFFSRNDALAFSQNAPDKG